MLIFDIKITEKKNAVKEAKENKNSNQNLVHSSIHFVSSIFHRFLVGSSTDLSPSVIAYYDRLSSTIEASTVNRVNSIDHRKQIRPPLPRLPPPASRLHNRRYYSVLSSNVQRLIAKSSTALDSPQVVDMDPTKLSIDTTLMSNGDEIDRKLANVKLPTTPPTVLASGKFKHPLSKNTLQLTRAGSDLIIDDSDAGYATPTDTCELIDTKNNNNHSISDEEKTPTNGTAPDILVTVNDNDDDDNNNSNVIANGAICDDKKDCKSLNNVPTSPSRNPWTYFQSTLSGRNSTSSGRQSQFYTDDDTTSETISNTSQTTAVVDNSSSIKTNQSTAKLRPLSSVSVSSTSSNSSSGSDELSTNQKSTSYLASVESLAEHSENETTKAKRVCKEIVDSEQIYCNDLGEVIDG